MESDLLKVGANVDIQRTDGTLGIPARVTKITGQAVIH